jgi:poly(A) polymerase
MQREQPPPASPRIDPAHVLPEADRVVRRLVRHGFRAYLVGGCVRDLLLGRSPKDFDLATSARPRQVKRLFRNSRIIGRRFRLVHIRFGPRILEVATFRAAPPDAAEGEDLYITRDNVFGTEEQDAFRRDFTINGLFYDLIEERVIDHVGGLEDLSLRRLRTIGDPDVRLREDPVRILRAAKFAGRLDFELTPELHAAARAHREDLRKSAPPRVLEEYYRLLSNSGVRRSFELLEELGALEILLPEIRPLAEDFLATLDRLEEMSGGDRGVLSQALLVAVLLFPVARPHLVEGDPHVVERRLQEMLGPLATRLTIARRDTTVARQLLSVQPRFLAPPHGRSARRLARHEIFHDACRLRRIRGLLEPVESDPLDEWERLAVHPARVPEERRRRRRRRGGKRRGLRRKPDTGKDGA